MIVTVLVPPCWAQQEETQARAAAAAVQRRTWVADAISAFEAMAGRQVNWHAGPWRALAGETASLREDYLNQVQRDFLSRPSLRSANTPSEVLQARACNRCNYGGAHRPHKARIGDTTTKQPAPGGLLSRG